MKQLPPRPNLDHLRRQAKELLAHYRGSDPAAIERVHALLPAFARRAAAGQVFRLADAQFFLAREYGFSSWTELRHVVEARRAGASDPDKQILAWLRLVYADDIAGGGGQPSPQAAARLLAERPGLPGDNPYLACAIGDLAAVERATAAEPAWVERPGGPLDIPPLIAVAHSSLIRLPAFQAGLIECARFLLAAGSDPNRSVGSRSAPASLSEPSVAQPLSALYGAAGQNRDPNLTQLLLEAGADPNDGESLYHSLENPTCTRLLLEGGARIAGTNAIYRVLDLDDVTALRLLLSFGGYPNEAATGEPTAQSGSPLLWAIRRRRSPAHIAALLDAGANASATTRDGTSAHTLALRFGLPDVAALLSAANPTGHPQTASQGEAFVAACAAADEATARRLQAAEPDIVRRLSGPQRRMLPELAALGCSEAVRLMVELGWPIETCGGDWGASALNHAVFRGDAELASYLLAHGASWRAEHGFGDNVCGTLSWASRNQPVDGGDWPGCAEVLLAHGLPLARPDPEGSDDLLIEDRLRPFSDDVAEVLLGTSAPQSR